MTWTLHIVGEVDPAEEQKLVNDIVATVEAAGHVLVQAVYSNDLGSTPLATTPPPEPEEPEPEVPTDTPPTLEASTEVPAAS